MQFIHVAVFASLGLTACGDEPSEVTRRLPCGGLGHDDGVLDARFVYEHDARGNVILEEAYEPADGPLSYRLVQAYDGDQVVSSEFESSTLSYREVNELEAGRIVRSTYTQLDPQGSVRATTWTWRDGQLEERATDLDDPDGPSIETFSRTDAGWESMQCDDIECYRSEYLGGRFVGDFARYTSRTGSREGDATFSYRHERTFDDHFLELTSDEYSGDGSNPAFHAYHTEYDREPDGTALRWRRVAMAPAGGTSTYTLEYDFECAND